MIPSCKDCLKPYGYAQDHHTLKLWMKLWKWKAHSQMHQNMICYYHHHVAAFQNAIEISVWGMLCCSKGMEWNKAKKDKIVNHHLWLGILYLIIFCVLCVESINTHYLNKILLKLSYSHNQNKWNKEHIFNFYTN